MGGFESRMGDSRASELGRAVRTIWRALQVPCRQNRRELG